MNADAIAHVTSEFIKRAEEMHEYIAEAMSDIKTPHGHEVLNGLKIHIFEVFEGKGDMKTYEFSSLHGSKASTNNGLHDAIAMLVESDPQNVLVVEV